MGNKALKGALIVSLSFNLAVVATLAYGWVMKERLHGPENHHEGSRSALFCRGCSRIARHIGLEGERAAEFERILVASGEETGELGRRLRQSRREMMKLLWDEESDEQAVLRKVEEISILQGELEKIIVQRLLRANSILSGEERVRLLHYMKRRMGPGFMMRKPWPAGGPAGKRGAPCGPE